MFQDFVDKEITGFQASEKAALPERIPENAVVALPANAALRTTTQHQQMWLWDPKVTSNLRWVEGFHDNDLALPSSCLTVTYANTKTHCSVPAAILTLNQTATGDGFKDWRVPSKQELDSFFTGRSAAFPIAAELNGGDIVFFINPRWETNDTLYLLGSDAEGKGNSPVMWTSEPVPGLICKRAASRSLHEALGPSTSNPIQNYPKGYKADIFPFFLGQTNCQFCRLPRRQPVMTLSRQRFLTPQKIRQEGSCLLLVARAMTTSSPRSHRSDVLTLDR
jgi:hypothetical protein